MTVVYVLIAILLFGVLITVHEAGHFTAAKLCGVKVNEFAVGMGPAIWKKKTGAVCSSIAQKMRGHRGVAVVLEAV